MRGEAANASGKLAGGWPGAARVLGTAVALGRFGNHRLKRRMCVHSEQMMWEGCGSLHSTRLPPG